MKAKHSRTLRAIFSMPTLAGIVFSDIEALFMALGAEIAEREGSRIRISLRNVSWHCYRPHPGKEARRYQVEEAREILKRLEITP